MLVAAGCSNLPPPDKKPQKEPGFKLQLPPSLENERPSYTREIRIATERVVRWFRGHGFILNETDLIHTAIVFKDQQQAKRRMSARYKISPDKIPDGFSGTVDGKTLYLLPRADFKKIYQRLYPDHGWGSWTYRQLATHELAHRAHALIATRLFGTEDGMGPRWFFEGLAILCANQFATPQRPYLTWQELAEKIAQDKKKTLHYPVYRRIFRSLAASFPVKHLVERAGKEGFVDSLEADYLPSDFVLEHPTYVRGRSRGSILLVHGSAPFNMEGRIPIAGLRSPYAKDRFYRDLSATLLRAGWSVLRYNKVGVHLNSVDRQAYAGTDVATLGRQLKNLWRFMPTDRPRIVFAWSEGSLHVRALPMREIGALILLGGISTTIGDVIRAQGGPPADRLRKELEGKPRTEMMGADRPVGRILDELSFDENWKVLAPLEELPVLVIHGIADKEVPVSQAEVWKRRLPAGRITVVTRERRDHRFMSAGRYDVAPLAKEITTWLDRLPVRFR